FAKTPATQKQAKQAKPKMDATSRRFSERSIKTERAKAAPSVITNAMANGTRMSLASLKGVK
ncbi:MAG: hypothetical protein V4772_27095, partial [Pseudomonadota bacterium]